MLVALVGRGGDLDGEPDRRHGPGPLPWLSNELVNALQTLIAALLAIGLALRLALA